jgi:predicted outer membrane repeat protein
LFLTDITFSGNSATSNGGGMYSSTLSNSTLADVTFSGNKATWGGGMYNWDNSPTLTNVTFSGNKATHGGGMFNLSSWGIPTLTNVTFSGNMAIYNGGGMFNNDSNPMLTNITFSSNFADAGGGMLNTSSNPTLTNVTFSQNMARVVGGMFNDSSSNPHIRNTIFWGNTGAQIYNTASSSSVVSDSVVQDGCPAGSTCTNIILADPLLGMLGNYGGFTQIIPLQSGSSAIDTGNDTVCPATDQRGVIRPQGGHCDIGAFELNIYWIYLPLILR